MTSLLLDQDIMPLSEFRSSAAKTIDKIKNTSRPTLLTQHGKGAAVLLNVKEYEAMREKLELVNDINTARQEIDNGEFYTNAEAKAYVTRKLSKWK
ncbi:antitoxin [Actinomycetota bacterium]|nr:antitoxin [Actinomycetota bacterium]